MLYDEGSEEEEEEFVALPDRGRQARAFLLLQSPLCSVRH